MHSIPKAIGCAKLAMHKHSIRAGGGRYIAAALGVTVVFFFVELIGGILTNSLALISDAWHMLNHVVALVLALTAAWIAGRPASAKRTYGYYRTEILAAFLNGILLWAVAIFIFYEAVQRFQHPTSVASLNMLGIALIGLAANGFSAAALSRIKEKDLNVKGAFLHVAADVLGSVGAISAGVVMLLTGWYQADPLISMFIAVLIFYSSGRLVQESVNVLLEGVPSGVDMEALEKRILGLKDVESVHDLHVWSITPTHMCCMSAHVVVRKGTDQKALVATLIDVLKKEFGISHATIQVEDEDYPKALHEH